MKGIICAGGSGSRLSPLTEVTNKHLLAVYDKPMIYYPLYTLLSTGITEIMIVSSCEHSGAFSRLLGGGDRFGAKFTFKVQEQSGGIAQAIGLCREFAAGSDVAVILGDNIFEDEFRESVESFKGGAKLFLKETEDASRFGVADLKDGKILSIEEKPANPKTNYAVTGFYLYDNRVFDIIDGLKFSARNELEITDVNNQYIDWKECAADVLKGEWTDAGTFESLYRANSIARKIAIESSLNYEHEKGAIRRISGVRRDFEVPRQISS